MIKFIWRFGKNCGVCRHNCNVVPHSWRSVVSFSLWPLYPGYPMDRRLDEPQSLSGQYGEVKILYPTGTQTPDPLVIRPTASHCNVYVALAQAMLNVEVFPVLWQALHISSSKLTLTLKAVATACNVC
jgi:hypothetical protein